MHFIVRIYFFEFDSRFVCHLGGSAGLRDYGESDHVIVMVRGDPAY